jgi:hypothetical protein
MVPIGTPSAVEPRRGAPPLLPEQADAAQHLERFFACCPV